MLFNVVLGQSKDLDSLSWHIKSDHFDNSFISNEYIRQSIRIGNNVNEVLDFVYEFEEGPDDANMAIPYKHCGFNIAKHIFITNNNRNMNLAIMNYWNKDDPNGKKHKDPDIIYLTLMNNDCTLASYELMEGTEILSTYRWKSDHHGCALVVSRVGPAEQKLITLTVKSSDFRFHKIDLYMYHKHKTPTLKVFDSIIEDGKELRELRTAMSPFSNQKSKKNAAPPCFKIQSSDPKRIMTSQVFVSSEKVDELEKFIGKKRTSNMKIHVIPTDISEKERRAIFDDISQELRESKIRALTVVDVRLPMDLLKDCGILYLFRVDLQNNKVECIRSH